MRCVGGESLAWAICSFGSSRLMPIPVLCKCVFAGEQEVDGEGAVPTHPELSPDAARVSGWRKLSLDQIWGQ